MSLTSHIENVNSPVRKFLDKQFPHTRSFAKEQNGKLSGVETVRPASILPETTWTMLDQVTDYRLRYYFPPVPFKELVAWKGAMSLSDKPPRLDDFLMEGVLPSNTPGDPTLTAELIHGFFRSLEAALGRLSPAGRRLDRAEEGELARYFIVLALFEQAYRMGSRPNALHKSLLFANGPKISVSGLLAIAEKEWVEDMCKLSWLFYDRCGGLLSSRTILNPTFEGSPDVGGADADLILDGCLIDIKTTINPTDLREWTRSLYQLIGYALLDYEDQFGISEAGVYFARQGALLRWTLGDLMSRLSGGAAPPLAEVRQSFREVARSHFLSQLPVFTADVGVRT